MVTNARVPVATRGSTAREASIMPSVLLTIKSIEQLLTITSIILSTSSLFGVGSTVRMHSNNSYYFSFWLDSVTFL